MPNGSNVTILPGGITDVSTETYKELMMTTGFSDVTSSDEIQVVEKTITSAQLLAIYTTPINLISAPGANKAILVEKVIASIDYGTAAYATRTDLEIRYDGSTAGDAAGIESTMASLDAILLKTADEIAVVSGLWQADEISIVINKGISAKVATGNPTAGDSDLKIRVYYRIVSL